MKLINFKILNFKSIIDSGSINISDIACFIGKNDSGKSSFFDALYRFNPLINPDIINYRKEDFPKDKIAFMTPHSHVIEALFELNTSEIEVINQKFGETALKTNQVNVAKDYSNEFNWDFAVNEIVYVKHLMKKKELPSEIFDLIENLSTISQCLEKLQTIPTPPKNLSSFINQLEILELRSMQDEIVEGYLINWLPKFYYLSVLKTIKNNISLKNANINLYKPNSPIKYLDPSIGFIKLIGIDIDEIIFGETPEIIQRTLQSLAANLNEKFHSLFPALSHLSLKFITTPILELDQTVDSSLGIFIENHKNNSQVSIEKGSLSFVQILSFISMLSVISGASTNTIILLDTPMSFLDEENQYSFCQYLHNILCEYNQVLYNTQSPLMINTDALSKLNIISNKNDLGSTIQQEINFEDTTNVPTTLRTALLLNKLA